MRNWRQWRRLAWLLTITLLLGGGYAAYRASQFARKELPLYLGQRLTEVLERPVAVGKVTAWPPGGFTLKRLEVLPGPGETKPLLTARRVRVYPSWWGLLRGQLQVRSLHFDEAHLQTTLDLAGRDAAQANVGAALISLSELGLRKIGLHNSKVDVTTVLANGEREPVSIRGVDFTAGLKRDSFDFRTDWKSWSAAGLTAQDLRFAGKGDARTVTLTDSRARFQGGRLEAKGTYVTQGGDVGMKVEVKELPLNDLTRQLGIPAEWAVQGNLTGTVDISATSGELRRVHGRVDVASGSISRSRAVFPWKTATAMVNWDQETITLRQIDVRGDGIRMQGQADLRGAPMAPFPERFFQADGKVEATSAAAVSALSRVLTFQVPVPGEWDVRQANLSFRAHGKVEELEDAHAHGQFQAQGLALKLSPNRSPLQIQTVRANVTRTGEHLEVTDLVATADGLTAGGQAVIVPKSDERAGTFRTSGHVDLTSLATLRQQMPDATFWQYVLPASNASRGRMTFTASGPTADPDRVSGRGSFRFQEFAGRLPAQAGVAAWDFPVRTVTGGLSLAGGDLAVRDVRLRSDLFTVEAQGRVRQVAKNGPFTGTARLVSSRWAELPPLKGRIPPALSGGTLALTLRARDAAPSARNLAGRAELRGAGYQITINNQPKRIQLQEAIADFHLAGTQLTIPSYRVVTPHFRTTGSGTGRQQGTGRAADWLVHAQGVLSSGNAGQLLRWYTGNEPVRGGALSANYVVDTRSSQIGRPAVTARLRLTNAQPVLPAGTLPFSAAESRIVALTGLFRLNQGEVKFQEMVWQAPQFRVAGSGSYRNGQVAGNFRLATPAWQRIAGDVARDLPVNGGTLVLTGHLQGPIDQLRRLPFRGTAELRGARLAKVGGWNLNGGLLDFRTQVAGTLDRVSTASLDGSFAVRNLLLPPIRAGASRLRIELARGDFRRQGSQVNLNNLEARAAGARVTGRGTLSGVGSRTLTHSFALNASGDSLARLLPVTGPVPGKVAGGRFTASLTVRGTPSRPANIAEGRAEVLNGKWVPPGQTVAMPIERMAAHFVRNGDRATLDNVEFRVPGGHATLAGTLQDLYASTGSRHALNLNWRLEDASGWAARFFPVPGKFTGGLFTGEAKIAGTIQRPAQTGDGKFEIRDAGFMPPQKFLGGPVKPISVSWARGLFRRGDGKTYLTDLDLNTSVGTATGTVTADDRGQADIRMTAKVSKLETLVDLWPGFSDRLRGGSGELSLALQGPLKKPRDLAGPVQITGRGGSFTVENVDELYAEHPFEELSTRLMLQRGGQVRIDEIKMRGPKANVDGKGVVTSDGRVDIRGKGWFAEGFTKKLVKPKILWPIAKLVGLKRIKSNYKIQGTLRQAKLDMSITDTLLWKLAIKKKVPEPLRRIAMGDVPLWSANDNRAIAGGVTGRSLSAYSASSPTTRKR